MPGPLKILIIEDEVFIGLSLEAELSRAGYDITGIAATGDEAIKKAAETVPDILLMDIHLAGDMDGLEAAKTIRENRDIPVIFMSGYADEIIQVRADSFNPIAFLIKPVKMQQLIQILNDAFPPL
ncbi:MAG TPA: response regulator, partial [Spirochaetota bacterium]|nr:response regulator [Spirochaetota bacterium]